MYVRKSVGPRTVTLDDGTILSRADLPPADTLRWVASRKAVVVAAVTHDLITRAEALARYDLSEEELDGWITGAEQFGRDALKATAVQRFR